MRIFCVTVYRWERRLCVVNKERCVCVLQRIYCNVCGTEGELYEEDVLLDLLQVPADRYTETCMKRLVCRELFIEREVYRERYGEKEEYRDMHEEISMQKRVTEREIYIARDIQRQICRLAEKSIQTKAYSGFTAGPS